MTSPADNQRRDLLMKFPELLKGQPGVHWTKRDLRPLRNILFVIGLIAATAGPSIANWIAHWREKSEVVETLHKLADRLNNARKGQSMDENQLLQLAIDMTEDVDTARRFLSGRETGQHLTQDALKDILGSRAAADYLEITKVEAQSAPLAERIMAIDEKMQENRSEITNSEADSSDFTYRSIVCGRAFSKRGTRILLECVNPTSAQKVVAEVDEDVYASMSKPIYGQHPMRSLGSDTYGVTNTNGFQAYQSAEVFETYELLDPSRIRRARETAERLRQENAALQAERAKKTSALRLVLSGTPGKSDKTLQTVAVARPATSKETAPLIIPSPTNCTSPNAEVSYASYTAEGVTFEYPASLTTQVRKSGSGTVYQLSSPDGCMRINVYHFFNVGRVAATAMLKQEEDAHEGVTYRFNKGDTFVLAGNEEGWAYYTRGLLHGKDKVYISEIEILVPNHVVSAYSDIVKRISKSMSATGAASEPEYVDSGVDWHATRNLSRDFYRIYVKSQARELEADYLSDAMPANCLQGIKEERQKRSADYAYCVQSYRDDVEAREKAHWGLK